MRETPGPAERGISHDAIHILFQPPRKNQPGLRNTKTLKLQRFREGSANQKIFLQRSPTEMSLFRSLLMSVLSFHMTTENQNGPITRIFKISSTTSVFYLKKSS